MSQDWPFDDPPNCLAYTTKQVMAGDTILKVYHEADDGAWQFIGGPWEIDDFILICLSHAVECDPAIRELADLPLGWMARRAAVGAAWVRYPIPDDEPTI